MLGTVHLGKQWSGQFKRDFHLLSDNKAPAAELLAAVLRHIDYVPDNQERAEALHCLEGMRDYAGSVDFLLACFKELPSLWSFAQAVDRGFTVIDKYTEAWRLIYGLYAPAGEGQSSALYATGVTEKPVAEVVTRLGLERSGRANTKIGDFLRCVREQGRECYVLELECCFGDLDDAAMVKDFWLTAALRAGGSVVRLPYTRYKLRERQWPLPDNIKDMAAGKLPFYDWRGSVTDLAAAQQTYDAGDLDDVLYKEAWTRYLLSSPTHPEKSKPAQAVAESGGEAAPGEEGGQRGENRAHLRFAWAEGIESGDAGLPDFEGLKAEGRRCLAEQTKADPQSVP